MLTRNVRARLAAAALTPVLGLSLVACLGTSEGDENRERATRTDVPFSSCAEAECTGEIDGAAFEIVMPERWNGTLLLYSHGYRQAAPAPPEFTTPSTAPEPAPGWSRGETQIGQALLDQGYALAGSAYAANGWAVEEGVAAGEALHDYFVDAVAVPDRVYVWGDSLGGLITQLLAERNPEWVTGAAPLCGVVGGPVANLDLALDVAYGLRTLIDPDLRLSGFTSWEDAVAQWESTAEAVVAAGSDLETGVPSILLIAALVDAPTQTRTFDGSTVESQVRARAESLLTALGYATFSRFEIEQRFGGNPSDNTGVDYSVRVDDEERTLIDQVGGAGTTDRLLGRLDAGERVSADTDARAAFIASGTPTGAVKDPTVMLHTVADPLVLTQNASLFAERAGENPDRTADFVQLFTKAPSTYSAEEGAPYGAGHCNFSADERLGVIELLDSWARRGVYPASQAIAETLGPETGYEPAYRPGPWPGEAG